MSFLVIVEVPTKLSAIHKMFDNFDFVIPGLIAASHRAVFAFLFSTSECKGFSLPSWCLVTESDRAATLKSSRFDLSWILSVCVPQYDHVLVSISFMTSSNIVYIDGFEVVQVLAVLNSPSM